MGVPTLYVRLLNEAGLTQDAVRNMRLFVSGSAPMLIETFNDWQQRTGHAILERYGMSETVMLTSNPGLPEDGQRGGTVGAATRCNCGARRRWQNGCQWAKLKFGQGLACFRPLAHAGEDCAEFTADGFFMTGDVGKVDSTAT
jgi:malonyl-CoA/methylmalonyl-CoA synthetase